MYNGFWAGKIQAGNGDYLYYKNLVIQIEIYSCKLFLPYQHDPLDSCRISARVYDFYLSF